LYWYHVKEWWHDQLATSEQSERKGVAARQMRFCITADFALKAMILTAANSL
jgi:hypothetical protein